MAVLPALAQQSQDIGPVTVSGFKTLAISSTTVTLVGTTGSLVHMASKDGRMEAKADEMVIVFDANGPKGGPSALKTAKLSGQVWIKSVPKPGNCTIATADNAFVDYARAQEATLTGNVQIVSTDSTLFIGPARIVGDRAIINLAQNLEPADMRIRIESSPEKSKLEFTPRETPKKTEKPK